MNVAASDPKRRALGKGLDSLLPRAHAPAAAAAPAEPEGGRPREIALDQIDPNPFQTRSQIDEEQLKELAASIVGQRRGAADSCAATIEWAVPTHRGRASLARIAKSRQADDSGNPSPGLR